MTLESKIVILLVMLSAICAGLWLQYYHLSGGGYPVISYSQFVRDLDADQYENVTVRGLQAAGKGKDGRFFRVTLPYLDPQLADDMAEHCEVTFEEEWFTWERGALAVVSTAALLMAWQLRQKKA